MNPSNINNGINNGEDGINNGCGGGGSGGGPCGACKFLRRKCVPGCVFAPYFDAEQGAAHFAAVHKVFGASNVSKLLHQIPTDKRCDAVLTTCYEAQARLRDPVYGCVGFIIALQQQVASLQTDIGYLHAHIAAHNIPPPFPPQQGFIPPPQFSMSDLPVITSAQPAYDLSFMPDPANQAPWAMPPQMDSSQFLGANPPRASTDSAIQDFINGDLQALAREFLERHAKKGPAGGTSNGGSSDNN